MPPASGCYNSHKSLVVRGEISHLYQVRYVLYKCMRAHVKEMGDPYSLRAHLLLLDVPFVLLSY